jgi:hypothetical protein
MKPFLILCSLAVLAAVVGPFFMKVNGQPIMTTDKLIDDSTPDALKAPTTVYRWQDAQGNWHFGNERPEDTAGQRVETIAVEERMTRLGSGWQGRPLTPAGEKPEVEFEVPGIAGYVKSGKAVMQDAVRETQKLNQRTEQLEAMRQSLR